MRLEVDASSYLEDPVVNSQKSSKTRINDVYFYVTPSLLQTAPWGLWTRLWNGLTGSIGWFNQFRPLIFINILIFDVVLTFY